MKKTKKPKDTALDLLVEGALGKFCISNPNNNTHSIKVDYLLTHINLTERSEYNEKLISQLAPVREVFSIQELSFEQIMQRDIDDGRVSKEIIPYILGETESIVLFPPIVVVVIHSEKKRPLKQYPSIVSEKRESEQEEFDLEILRSGKIGKEVFELKKYSYQNSKVHHGELKLNSARSSLLIVDGQHRAMSLIALHRNLNGWPENAREYRHFYQKWTKKKIESYSLEEIELPVMFCLLTGLEEQNKAHSLDLLEACRSVFVSLNSTHSTVQRSKLPFLTPDKNEESIIGSFLDVLPKELAEPNLPRWNFDFQTDEQYSSPLSILSPRMLTELTKNLTKPEKIRVRFSSRHIQQIFQSIFLSFAPFAKNVKAINEVCSELKASTTNEAGIVFSMLFKNPSHLKIFEQYAASEPLETFKIKKELQTRIKSFHRHRALEFCSELNQKVKNSESILAYIHKLYENVFTSREFQESLVNTFVKVIVAISEEKSDAPDLEEYLEDYITHLNHFFFPQSMDSFRKFTSFMYGGILIQKGTETSTYEAHKSKNAFDEIFNHPKEKSYDALLLELWQSEHPDLEEALGILWEQAREETLEKFVMRKIKERAKHDKTHHVALPSEIKKEIRKVCKKEYKSYLKLVI